MDTTAPHIPTVIIGGGQAGLAMAHELAVRGRDYLVFDAYPRIGDAWRRRWDSLRLFTPAEHDGLPARPFPAERRSLPTKDDMADYLESYALAGGLRVRLNSRVSSVSRNGGEWTIVAGGQTMRADAVVIAAGTNSSPRLPPFASALDAATVQLHSSEYRNAADIPAGDVLVVGAGTSGAEIALELAAAHRVTIAGRPTVHIPDLLLRHAGGPYWRFVNSVLTRDTPIGRRAAAGFERRGAPLIGTSMAVLNRAGVTRVGRIEGVKEGLPMTCDGQAIAARTVVWATGYRPDLTWLGGVDLQPNGWPAHERGVVESAPGLYFLGIPFQYALTSGLIGGVGRDAAHLADQITRTAPTTARAAASS